MFRPQAICITAAMILAGGSGTGCAHRRGPDSSPPASIIRVEPDSASPGMRVQITSNQPVFNVKEPPRVQVGKQPAKIAETTSTTEVSIIVPNLESGDADVQLLQDDKKLGKPARFKVLPAQSQRLILTFANDRVKLVDAAPRAGGYVEGAREGGRRLSYDLVNDQGAVMFTGSVLHPLGGRSEVFDETPNGKRIINSQHPHAQATFVLKIPNVPGGVKVRFYDVLPGVDLASEQGRTVRVLLNEIKVGG
jgi:hypothetical protein